METELQIQRAFLLGKIASSKSRSLAGSRLTALSAAMQADLHLDGFKALELLSELARNGYVTEKKGRGKSVTYSLTEAGTAYAATLPPYPPLPVVTPAHNDLDLLDRQRDYVLYHLWAAEGHKLSRSEIKKRATSPRAKSLKFNEAAVAWVLSLLLKDGLARQHKRGKTSSYALTESGSGYAQALPPQPPPVRLQPTHDNARLLEQQKAYALFELYAAKDHRLTVAQLAKKLIQKHVKPLRFDRPSAGTISWVLSELQAEGSVWVDPLAKAETYELMADGIARLAASDQHDEVQLTLSGAAFNELCKGKAAGVAAHPPESKGPGLPHRPADEDAAAKQGLPVPEELREAVYVEFRELLREKYWRDEQVPIHEIRARIATQFGKYAARHDTLDEQIKQLRRHNRVRLISLSDLSRATPQELAESVPGDNETFFYLGEPA